MKNKKHITSGLLLLPFFFILPLQFSFSQVDKPNFYDIKKQQRQIEKAQKDEAEAQRKLANYRAKQVREEKLKAQEEKRAAKKLQAELERWKYIRTMTGAFESPSACSYIVAYTTIRYHDDSYSITISRNGTVETYFNEGDGVTTGTGTSNNSKNKAQQHKDAVREAIEAKEANGVGVRSTFSKGPSEYK